MALRNVENVLDRFVDMNLEMHKTGSLSASIGKDELLKLVAQVWPCCQIFVLTMRPLTNVPAIDRE